MKLDQLRASALSLPEVTEEPHFHYSSFRVRGKIFVTLRGTWRAKAAKTLLAGGAPAQ